MNKNTSKVGLGIVVACAFSVLIGASSAQALAINTQVNAGVTATGGVKVTAAMQTRIATGKDRADKEIDRRTTIMTDLIGKINGLVRLSANEKTTLSANLQSQIDAMTSLKAKIATDTDIATLKTDIQSITKAYRIFMLIIPQAHVAATADAMVTTVDAMNTLETKLQTRIMAVENTGKDTTALLALLTDFKAKSTDAMTQATAAVTVTASLQPDNGDKTVMQTNTTAFTTAKADIKSGQADLKAARADAAKIIAGLKVTGAMKVEATSTTQVQ